MTHQPVTSFKGQYDFLSNFYPIEVKMDHWIYPTVEHAFQAAKTTDNDVRYKIWSAKTPGDAKRQGRQCQIRQDWDTIRLDIMRDLLRQKFSDFQLAAKLILTGESELIESNTWNDTYWGCVEKDGQWEGENHLGKLLMEIRAELTANPR